jgi:hypothetical protein
MSAHKLIAVTIASAFALAACSGGEGETTSTSGGGQACPFDYAGYDGTAAVSFDTDVFPVVRRSCGFMPCHGKPIGSSAGLYLGPPLSDMMTVVDMALKQQIIDSLAGVPSNTAVSMNRVTVNDPSQSFLMLKIDGCQLAAGLTCTLQGGGTSMDPCGEEMPPGQPLDAAERDLFRRWISHGAQND